MYPLCNTCVLHDAGGLCLYGECWSCKWHLLPPIQVYMEMGAAVEPRQTRQTSGDHCMGAEQLISNTAD